MNYDFHLKHTTQDTIVYSYTLSTKLNPALEDRSQMWVHAWQWEPEALCQTF